jgi:hypothetical protein
VKSEKGDRPFAEEQIDGGKETRPMIKSTLVALALGTTLLGAVATGAHAGGPLSAQPSAVPTGRSDASAPAAAQHAEDTGRITPRRDDAVTRVTIPLVASCEDTARRSTAPDNHVALGGTETRTALGEHGDH